MKTKKMQLMQQCYVGLLLIACTQTIFAEGETENYSAAPWWKGFSINPGVGLRMMSFFVTRKADDYSGSIASWGGSRLFWGLNIGTPSYAFKNTNLGVSLQSFSSYVIMDSQWYDYNIETPVEGEALGERINLGTSVKGFYNYLVPMVHYQMRGLRFAAGVGVWRADFAGDIVLAPNTQPNDSMPSESVKVGLSKIAYLALLRLTSRSGWQMNMTVGGPRWNDKAYDYKMEEISMSVAKQFVF
ncbi:MAG: hypothetical protein OEY38_00630 [Gammaproteobacteria bacterium]|nr:hypothetical protein [Gammaproteobacteria bacterium]